MTVVGNDIFDANDHAMQHFHWPAALALQIQSSGPCTCLIGIYIHKSIKMHLCIYPL